MGSSKRSKRSSAATCSASSKPSMKKPVLFYLLASALLALPLAALGETGVVAASGAGRDTAEAMSSLLRTTVGKYFRDQPAPLARSILQAEILPNASSFVQS